jgi:PAS domain S-box-containing protein
MTPLEILSYLSRFLDALYCGAAIIERGGRVLFVNRRLCEMCQREAESLIGQNMLDLYRDGDGRAFVRNLLENFDQPHESEFYLPRLDGQRVPVVASGRVLNGDSPLSNWRIATMIDISPQKAAEHARAGREAQQLLPRARGARPRAHARTV